MNLLGVDYALKQYENCEFISLSKLFCCTVKFKKLTLARVSNFVIQHTYVCKVFKNKLESRRIWQ